MNTTNPIAIHVLVGSEYPSLEVVMADGHEPKGDVRSDVIATMLAARPDGAGVDRDDAPRLDLEGAAPTENTLALALGRLVTGLVRRGYVVTVREVAVLYAHDPGEVPYA